MLNKVLRNENNYIHVMRFAFKILQNYELSPKSYAFNNSLTSQFIIYG
jgi:hypothetical protein